MFGLRARAPFVLVSVGKSKKFGVVGVAFCLVPLPVEFPEKRSVTHTHTPFIYSTFKG